MYKNALNDCDEAIDKMRYAPQRMVVYDALLDSLATAIFAENMKEKLSACRVKGRGDWPQCSSDDLWKMLREHVEKGDPTDIANIAMMIWHIERRSIARSSDSPSIGRNPAALTTQRDRPETQEKHQ